RPLLRLGIRSHQVAITGFTPVLNTRNATDPKRMTERDSLETKLQQLHKATNILSRKWEPLIFYTIAMVETARYTDIEEQLDDISPKMLTQGLENLSEYGLITSESQSNADSSMYRITDKGYGLVPALSALRSWALYNQGQQGSILIVEDEKMVANMERELLPNKYEIRHTVTGDEALSIVSNHNIDLIILDRDLPTKSADDLAAEFKTQMDQCLILIVSGYAPDEDILQLEIDDYIQKPITEEKLSKRVEQLLVRAEFNDDIREYLALKSKQHALVNNQGEHIKTTEAYKKINKKLDNINIPQSQQEVVRNLAPPQPSKD
ncbi:MAG: response regulator, partial [Halobacteriaceae archaeon]